jgi:hypothetical protein
METNTLDDAGAWARIFSPVLIRMERGKIAALRARADDMAGAASRATLHPATFLAAEEDNRTQADELEAWVDMVEQFMAGDDVPELFDHPWTHVEGCPMTSDCECWS